MSQYSLTSLSSRDFEELTRDLLQAEWNVPLESFKVGRDNGIDLRYAPADSGKTIIQCKHYAVSGYNKLLSHLRGVERPKIERLRPDRYVVVTSVGLTPDNKNEINEALEPFVRSPSDILGANEIDGLLSRHPQVERAHFKLWLTSTSVIERVLHNAELCHTEFKVESIRRKLPLFVQSEAFPRAMRLLQEGRIVIISGLPGIGKTTLAEILLYAHLERGYEPIIIQAEIAEGKKLFRHKDKQIFYYDDFLGESFLGDRAEYLGRNQDAALLDFMDMVTMSEHGRFILTTREHILGAALQISERFAHSRMIDHKCVLSLGDYSFSDKARILYSHLYFSAIPPLYKQAVLRNDFFLSIVKDQRFNPRLIEWLSTPTMLRGVEPDGYREHIRCLLKSPERIWNHAFQNQISEAARSVLLTVYMVGGWGETIDLEPVFISLHRHNAQKYHRQTAPGDFRRALQELDGAFLTYRSGRASFLNPSIREYVAGVISESREIAEDLLVSAVRFRQIAQLWELAGSAPQCELALLLQANEDLFYQSAARLLVGPWLRWTKGSDGTQRGHTIDMMAENRLVFLIELSEAKKSARFEALAHDGVKHLIHGWERNFVYFRGVIGILESIGKNEWFFRRGGRSLYRKLLDAMLGELARANADDWTEILEFPSRAVEWTENDKRILKDSVTSYVDNRVSAERAEYSTVEDMAQLREALNIMKEKHGLDLSYDIDRLDEEISERDSRPVESGEDRLSAVASAPIPREMMSDDDVRQMFLTLGEDHD